MMKNAHEARKKKSDKNKRFMFNFIKQHPEISVYQISKKINWAAGKVHHYIIKLLKEKKIERKTKIVNGRINNYYSCLNYF